MCQQVYINDGWRYFHFSVCWCPGSVVPTKHMASSLLFGDITVKWGQCALWPSTTSTEYWQYCWGWITIFFLLGILTYIGTQIHQHLKFLYSLRVYCYVLVSVSSHICRLFIFHSGTSCLSHSNSQRPLHRLRLGKNWRRWLSLEQVVSSVTWLDWYSVWTHSHIWAKYDTVNTSC